VQGDEPFLPPALVAQAAGLLEGDAAAGIRTLAVRAGLRRALEAAVACAVAAAGLSLVPYLLSAYGTGYLVIIVAGAYPVLGACCFRIIGALRTEGADLEAAGRGGARLLKAVMPVGLAAFLAAGV
jgi:4-hydroxybenzoate polyprenyltransferase